MYLTEAVIAEPRALVANFPANPECTEAVREYQIFRMENRAELPNVDSGNMILIGIRVPLIAERLEKARDDLLTNSKLQERQ